MWFLNKVGCDEVLNSPEHSSDLSSKYSSCKVCDGGNSVIVSFCPTSPLLSIIN